METNRENYFEIVNKSVQNTLPILIMCFKLEKHW